jgi:hypothetical protein
MADRTEDKPGNDSSRRRPRAWNNKRRIREGKTRGGVNEAPKTPRPNVRPGPQKPTGSSENSQESDGDE